MTRAGRIDRKALKEDPLLNFTSRATEWVGKNANLAIGIVAAVIVAAVLLGFWSRGRETKTSESDLRISAVLGNYHAGQYQAALDMAEGVRTSYPGTRAATIVSFVAGQAQLRLGNPTAAEQAFRSYLDAQDKAPVYATAAAQGLAASLEAQRRYAEAAQQYMDSAANLPADAADQTRIDAARCYRYAGDTAQARTLLVQVKDNAGPHSRRATIDLAVLDAVGAPPPTAPVATPPLPTP